MSIVYLKKPQSLYFSGIIIWYVCLPKMYIVYMQVGGEVGTLPNCGHKYNRTIIINLVPVG